MHLSFNSAIPLLRIYPEDALLKIEKCICTKLVTTASFIIVEYCKLTKYSSIAGTLTMLYTSHVYNKTLKNRMSPMNRGISSRYYKVEKETNVCHIFSLKRIRKYICLSFQKILKRYTKTMKLITLEGVGKS